MAFGGPGHGLFELLSVDKSLENTAGYTVILYYYLSYSSVTVRKSADATLLAPLHSAKFRKELEFCKAHQNTEKSRTKTKCLQGP